MPAKAKLTVEQVKRIRRRVRAGEQISDLAVEYGVNRKTIRRRVDAAELADAERARRTAARRAAEKRMKRLLGPDYRNPDRAPEHRRDPPPPSDKQPAPCEFWLLHRSVRPSAVRACIRFNRPKARSTAPRPHRSDT